MNLLRLKNLLKKHFENNFSFYFLLIFIFIIGVIFGAILFKGLSLEKRLMLLQYSNPYLKNTLELKLNSNVFKKVFFNNMLLVLLMYFGGLASVGFIVIPVLLFIKGSLLGLLVGYFTHSFNYKGFFISVLGVYPQYLFYILGIVGIGALSMTMSYRYKFSRNLKIIRAKKMEYMDYTIFTIFYTLFIIIGSLYEGFISPMFLRLLNF